MAKSEIVPRFCVDRTLGSSCTVLDLNGAEDSLATFFDAVNTEQLEKTSSKITF